MKYHYSTIKYHGYIIEGIGTEYKLYHPDGLVGTFSTSKEAKSYVDRERKEADNLWNKAVLEEYYSMLGC